MSERFFKVAVLALIVGVGLGLFMGISHEHGYIDTHSHVALMGWVSMAIFGFAYRFWPQLEKGWLRQGHFWLYTVGFVVTVLGLMLLESGKAAAGDPLAGIGSTLSVLGVLCFAVQVLRLGPRPTRT
jgi:hypothetical protein